MSKLNRYYFVLVLGNVTEDTENLEDHLFEAGCDDALINIRNNTVYLDFGREASNFEEAIISAIKQIERAGIGAKVISVEPATIVISFEIAKQCDLSRQAISLLVNEKRRDGILPYIENLT